jgi:protein tyrosine/serine phosphatase
MRALPVALLLALAAPAYAQVPVAADPRRALVMLAGADGPLRFGIVRDGLYRGGQPTARHLELLHQLGVETVIDLRRGSTKEEEAVARRLGMRFLRFPFYGIFGADRQFLARVVEAIRDGGRVYVHCEVGRDRTSLVVALYRVLVEGWDPAVAWQREAVAYGYRRGLFYGAIADSFDAAVRGLRAKR